MLTKTYRVRVIRREVYEYTKEGRGRYLYSSGGYELGLETGSIEGAIKVIKDNITTYRGADLFSIGGGLIRSDCLEKEMFESGGIKKVMVEYTFCIDEINTVEFPDGKVL